MHKLLKRLSIESFIVLAILMLSNAHCFAQSFRCNPLLILIEGANQSVVSGIDGTDGESMTTHARQIVNEFNKMDIPIVLMDNEPFWSNLNVVQWEKIIEAAEKIGESGFNRIVIVGHSLGGPTAYDIADFLSVKMIVTLDAISYPFGSPHIKRKPFGAKEWWNIWVGDIFPPVTIFPKSWRQTLPADVNFRVPGNVGHSDIDRMWHYNHPIHGSVRDAVLDALSCDYPYVSGETNPSVLCHLDSIGCMYFYHFTTTCTELPKIKIFEQDIAGQNIDNIEVNLGLDKSVPYYAWKCRSPANRVCWGGSNSFGESWGVGLNGKLSCENCCAPCFINQDVDIGKLEVKNLILRHVFPSFSIIEQLNRLGMSPSAAVRSVLKNDFNVPIVEKSFNCRNVNRKPIPCLDYPTAYCEML